MRLTREDVRAFLNEDHDTVISIYIPTERKAYQPEQNSLVLRSGLRSCAEQLEDRGLRQPQIKSLLSPLHDLLDDGDFWLHQREGLALFCSDSNLETVKLPFKPVQSVRVAKAPHLVPLLEGVATGERHALLAVSQDGLRLFSCTRDEIEQIDIDDLEMPRSLAEALQYDDLQKPELSHHPTTGPGRAGGGKGPGGGRNERQHAFHGHGEDGEGQKSQIAGYLRQVDGALQTRLHDLGSPPLILAGVDYVTAIYRGVTKYPAVVSPAVEGNPDDLRPDELHSRARELLHRRWSAKVNDARSRFNELAARGLATAHLRDVVDAADMGRVDTLLVRKGSSAWGRLDPQTRSVTFADEVEEADDWDDLIDLAARRTLANDGRVMVLEPDHMIDGDAGAAAMLRY
ncbi:MAG: hypothetical protein ACRDK3_03460 [Actinomycetota bacterium]